MSIKKQLLLILILIGVLIVVQLIVYAGHEWSHISPLSVSAPAANENVRIPPPQPPMTASDTVAEQDKHPFSVLISYVDAGFEPAIVHVNAGETVRFTNNSTKDLWVAASGKMLYPRAQESCGSSELDSCQPLTPGQFWQFTFTKKGTWQYVNNLDKSKQGTVVVQ